MSKRADQLQRVVDPFAGREAKRDLFALRGSGPRRRGAHRDRRHAGSRCVSLAVTGSAAAERPCGRFEHETGLLGPTWTGQPAGDRRLRAMRLLRRPGTSHVAAEATCARRAACIDLPVPVALGALAAAIGVRPAPRRSRQTRAVRIRGVSKRRARRRHGGVLALGEERAAALIDHLAADLRQWVARLARFSRTPGPSIARVTMTSLTGLIVLVGSSLLLWLALVGLAVTRKLRRDRRELRSIERRARYAGGACAAATSARSRAICSRRSQRRGPGRPRGLDRRRVSGSLDAGAIRARSARRWRRPLCCRA